MNRKIKHVQLSNEVFDIQDPVGRERDLQSRKFLIIADSYGILGWTSGVVSRLSLDADVINAGGAGFAGAGGGYTWRDKLIEFCNVHTQAELAEYTDILIMGGINDYGINYNTIVTAAESFITYATAALPNALITCGCLSWCSRSNDVDGYVYQVFLAYQKAFTAHSNTAFVKNAFMPMHNYNNIDNDGIHPNNNGTADIIAFISNYLLTGSQDWYVNDVATLTASSGVTMSANTFLTTIMDQSGVDLVFTGTVLILDTPKKLESGSYFTEVMKISGGCLRGYIPSTLYQSVRYSVMIPVPCTIVNNADNKVYDSTLLLSFGDGQVAISGVCIDETHLDYVYASSITIAPFTAHVGLMVS